MAKNLAVCSRLVSNGYYCLLPVSSSHELVIVTTEQVISDWVRGLTDGLDWEKGRHAKQKKAAFSRLTIDF